MRKILGDCGHMGIEAVFINVRRIGKPFGDTAQVLDKHTGFPLYGKKGRD
jgi:hypothetical protein